jgi:hypothetical protein
LILFVTQTLTHLWFEFWYLSPISVIILPTRFIGGKPGQYNEITDKNLIMVGCQLETLTLDIDLWV